MSKERELSPNEIELDLILADFGKVSDGKMDLMGAGWSNLVGPHIGPCCLAVMAKVPSSWAGQELHLVLELLDEDGQLVGHAPRLEIKGVNPTSPKPGVPVDLMQAFNFQPFPVVPNRTYQWRATVNGKTSADWHRSFFVGDGTPPKGILRPAS